MISKNDRIENFTQGKSVLDRQNLFDSARIDEKFKNKNYEHKYRFDNQNGVPIFKGNIE